MKILFLHLSDMHIKKTDRYLDKKAEKLLKAINLNVDYDKFIILVSGDVAFSGKKEEYKLAFKFFGTLVAKSMQEYGKKPTIYVVPGNHDINFADKSRSRSEVNGILKNGITQKNLRDEYAKFDDFWIFANYNQCFLEDKEIDRKIVDLNDVKIQINLINSALLSTFNDYDKDVDDGCHYISPNKLNLIKKLDDIDYSITIMHHPVQYFSWDCRKELKAAILENTDLLILGHEHNSMTYEICSNNGESFVTIKGGEFSNGDLIHSDCGAFVLDSNIKELRLIQYKWQDSENIYLSAETQTYHLDGSKKNLVEFNNWLLNDESNLLSKQLKDFYVFPRLLIKKVSEEDTIDKDIVDFEKFREIIDKKRIIEISGSDLSGKTSLLKYIYFEYRSKYTPLMITEEDIAGKIENIIRNAYERQYSKDYASFQKYLQQRKEDKIILIDDITFFPDRIHKKMIEYLLEKYEKIFYTTDTTSEFNIKKELEETLADTASNIIKLKLEPFYNDKRLELIKKVCSCIQNYKDDSCLLKDANKVNNFIKNQLHLFTLNPEFIIMFTKGFILKMVENSNTNAFNAVFSNNINLSIEKHKKKTNVQDNLIILQELANYIHFNKKYPVEEESFKDIVQKYNNEHRTDHFYRDVLNELEEAKILNVDRCEISFYNKTYLAYFVAKFINRKIQNGAGSEELKYVIDNLCYNINSDILLFLTYITENISALWHILSSEMEYSKKFKEYSIDNADITLLVETANVDKVKTVSIEEKKQKSKNEVVVERRMFENENIQKVNFYQEDLDEFTVKELQLIKYLELISKILPSFYHLLNVKEQDAFVEEIYKLPNRIAYFLFKPLEENKDQLIEELYEFIKNNENMRKLDRTGVKQLLSRILTDMLLTLYDLSARWSVTDRTIRALDSFDYKQDSSYFVHNVMMHENLGEFKSYIERSDELFDQTKSNYVKYLLKKVFRKHCLNNNIEYKGDGQKYIDKYLDKQNIVAMRLIYHSKNK